MYRIYINEAVLIIGEKKSQTMDGFQTIDFQFFNFNSLCNNIINNNIKENYVLLTKDPKQTFKELRKKITVIKAAGGLVENEENQYLFIFRRAKWDLPKGKIDEGEKTKKAAVREVEEECGIKVNEVKGKLCKTYHVYTQGGQLILKKTTWYKMKAINQPDLIPQLEEDITDARWLSPNNFEMVNQNTFPLILDVLQFLED